VRSSERQTAASCAKSRQTAGKHGYSSKHKKKEKRLEMKGHRKIWEQVKKD